MLNALLITSDDLFFDIRSDLKCRRGCEDYFARTIKCYLHNHHDFVVI